MVVQASIRDPKVKFEWFNESFDLFRRDIGTWVLTSALSNLSVGLLAVASVAGLDEQILAAIGHPIRFTAAQSTELLWGGSLLNYLLQAIWNCVMMCMANKALRGERLRSRNILVRWHLVLPFFVYELPLLTAALSGNGALFVLALSLGVFLLPGNSLLADGYGLRTATLSSVAAMRVHFWRSFGFYAVYIIVVWFSSCICGIGALVAIPMAAIISSLCCRDMIAPQNFVSTAEVIETPDLEGAWPPSPATTVELTEKEVQTDRTDES